MSTRPHRAPPRPALRLALECGLERVRSPLAAPRGLWRRLVEPWARADAVLGKAALSFKTPDLSLVEKTEGELMQLHVEGATECHSRHGR